MKDNKEMIDHLMEAIINLQTEEECEKFFSDLCSETEIQALKKRILIAKYIINGYTYREILEETNASTATISRIKNVITNEEESTLANILTRITDSNITVISTSSDQQSH